jgi:hypothetical protein
MIPKYHRLEARKSQDEVIANKSPGVASLPVLQMSVFILSPHIVEKENISPMSLLIRALIPL